METNITPGIISLIVGIGLFFGVGRRRFSRRGPGGMQHSSSYGRALVIAVIERVAKVLGWVLIVCGLLWFLHVWQVGRGRRLGRCLAALGRFSWGIVFRWGDVVSVAGGVPRF